MFGPLVLGGGPVAGWFPMLDCWLVHGCQVGLAMLVVAGHLVVAFC